MMSLTSSTLTRALLQHSSAFTERTALCDLLLRLIDSPSTNEKADNKKNNEVTNKLELHRLYECLIIRSLLPTGTCDVAETATRAECDSNFEQQSSAYDDRHNSSLSDKCDLRSRVCVLGVSGADLIAHNPSIDEQHCRDELSFDLKALLTELEPLLRCQIDDECENEGVCRKKEDQKVKVDADVSIELEKKIEQMHNQKMALIAAQEKTRTTTHACIKMLTRELALLKDMIGEHKLNRQFELDQAHVNVLSQRVKALLGKLKVIKNRLRKDTYTPDSVQALRCIREKLKSNIVVEQASFEKAERQVHAYEGIAEFDAIVEQYSALEKKIELQRDLLKQIAHDH